jgi:hypothetical protein
MYYDLNFISGYSDRVRDVVYEPSRLINPPRDAVSEPSGPILIESPTL